MPKSFKLALYLAALAGDGLELCRVEVVVEFENSLLITHRYRCAGIAGEGAVAIEGEAL